MAINLNPGRQYPLVLIQPIAAADIAEASVSVKVASLPRDAVILSGHLMVTTAFSAGSLDVGITGDTDAYGSLDAATTGIKTLTPTGLGSDKTELFVTPDAAMSAGEGVLYVTYVLPDRANEAQP